MATARRIIILLIAGFLLGIFLGSLVDFGNSAIGLFLLLTLVFVGLFFICDKERIFAIIALVCFGLVLGLIRYSLVVDSVEKNTINNQSPIVGIITADPDRRDNSTRLTVSLLRKTTWLHEVAFLKSSPAKILIITDNFVDYAYGDQIEITGKLERPQNFLIDTGTIFDYQNYLKVRRIEQISYYPKIKVLARGQGSIIKASLFKLKNSFLDNLKQVLPEPSATLAGGLILGDKGGLGQKTENEFRQAGISHIVVLSGYNITVVAENVLKFFAWFTPAWSWLLGLVSIILLVMMTGGEAAAVRSAVMGAIALIARRHGRTYDAGVALVFAGFLMVLWNPRLLTFDLGFQLSFLATLGMIYLSPIVEKAIDKVSGFVRSRIWLREKRLLTNPSPVRNATSCNQVVFRTGFLSGLKEIISTTTGAQLAIYPWLLYKAGNASLVGFIANIFVLPAVPLAMFLSFVTGIAGFISCHLSLLASYPTYFFLDYILIAAHWFASLV
ncbi:MAG: ComEC/Rec2 family competence protein [Candidatus Paceibacterota bacterium]|jgi:competence protein ComEC